MYPRSMDGFRVVKLSEVIRQMDVVITCTGTVPHAAISITYALIITVIHSEMHTSLKYFNSRSLGQKQTFHLNAKMLCVPMCE